MTDILEAPLSVKKSLRVLVVEDSLLDAELLAHELSRGGYDLTWERVETADAMKAALDRAPWDVIVSDYSLPAFSGPAALQVMQSAGQDAPFIIVSGTIGEETAVSALRAGACDFLTKGHLARLLPTVERELRDGDLRRERARTQAALEEQLRQAQKMEAIGQLAGGIAHDFNNLLTAILGYSELLTDQIGPDKPLGRDLREIMTAAQRAAALTRQLLAFSRKQVLTVTALDLNQVVRDIEAMLRRLIGEHITITTELAADLHAVMADATQLEQVLMNLAVNARDAMPHGGALTIRTWNAIAEAGDAVRGAGLRVSLSVTDAGTGMAPEIQARIFEPFFTTKERGHGTGLGLAAVHGIVTQLGGSIAVESVVGHGTTFRIDLPATRAAVAPTMAAAAGSAPVGAETILLVEDEQGVRAFIGLALKRFGYQVLEADSAESALVLIEQDRRPIHLLLTDVILPKMGGRDLAARLGDVRPGLPVLFMSGYTEQFTTAGGFLEPGVQLLEKPFTAHALLTRVRHILNAQAS
jgi:two-component system, cell cycle sensor histidine kinase and response regulator CckA